MTERSRDDHDVIERFFEPRRVAIVGASRNRRSVGGVLLRNVLDGGFDGAVYPVNPDADVIQAVTAYPSLGECPAVPDLAIVAVPAPAVCSVVEEAGRLGVGAVCVISAGFAETGGDGEALERELVETARDHGVRIVGPNCMGVLNASAEVRLNATFSSNFPPPGRIALLSQSGAVGLTVLDHAASYGIGLSSFVSIGNRADVSVTELIEHSGDDDDTDVILLYLESFDDPRGFSRVARRVGRDKPIVAVKSGRTGAGERAASSHTAAVAAGEVAVEALFAQTGVIRADTLEEMFEVAAVLTGQPPPPGGRIGIVTNGGGPGILAADACDANRLEVPELDGATQDRLREFLPPAAAFGNPVDLLAGAEADSYRRAVATVAAADDVDALIVIFIPPIVTRPDDVADALVAAGDDLGDDIPIVAVFMGGGGHPSQLADAGIPTFSFPEEAVRALGRAAQWSAWRRAPVGEIVEPGGIDREAARSIIDRDDADGGDGERWLSTAAAMSLLEAYAVPTARHEIVTTPDEAAAAQRELGVPVAIKIDAPIHKTDVGGLAVGVRTSEEAAETVASIRRRLDDQELGEHAGAFVVQEMVEGDVEMAVGVNRDPLFGPLVMIGLGGELLELLGDVSVRVTPVTDRDVDTMLDSLRSRQLLSGYRGRPPVDVEALKDLLHRINALVDDVPEIAELDLNPVFVRPDGVVAVDVRIKIAP